MVNEKISIKMCQYCWGLNPGLLDYEQNALPTELVKNIVSGTKERVYNGKE